MVRNERHHDTRRHACPWVYIRTGIHQWTVGFYDGHGQWQAEADYSSPEAAAERVHYLNGGMPQESDRRKN